LKPYFIKRDASLRESEVAENDLDRIKSGGHFSMSKAPTLGE
jgi:hypothetical protein